MQSTGRSSISSNLLMARLVQEMARKELARRNLLDFACAVMPDFVVAPHHRLICNTVDAWRAGDLGNTMLSISMPPRHTKSLLCSQLLPALVLGQAPWTNIIHISYAASLTNEFSRRIRSMIRDDRNYRSLFPAARLDPDKTSVSNWRMREGGGVLSVGAGGGVTGHGADLMIIDDVHKEGDQLSPTTLETTTQWYASAARTRLSPQGRVLLVGTRWDLNDLFGYVYSREGSSEFADKWHKLVLPGVALDGDPLGRAAGEPLWPAWFPLEALLALRALDPALFDALYQQDPRASKMVMFQEQDFLLVDERPAGFEGDYPPPAWVFDLALGQTDAADNNAWAEARLNYATKRLLLSSMHREREAWPLMKQRITRMLTDYPNHQFVFQPHSFDLMAVQELRFENPDQAHRIITVRDMKGDKVERAQVAAVRGRAGGIILQDCPGRAGWIEEHTQFPAGAHDDGVDVTSLALHHFGLHRLFYQAQEGYRQEAQSRLASAEVRAREAMGG